MLELEEDYKQGQSEIAALPMDCFVFHDTGKN
jgi:hypothetical protein